MPPPVKQEEHSPTPDSEDSLTVERVAEELQRLTETREPMVKREPTPHILRKKKELQLQRILGARLWPICFARSRKT